MSAEIIYLKNRAIKDPNTCDHADGITCSMQAGKDTSGEPWIRIQGMCEDCGATIEPKWEPDARTIGAILVEAAEHCNPGNFVRSERLMEILRGEEDEDNP